MDTMWYEEAQIGAGFTTTGRTVTETDIVNFAGVSGDFDELHTNAALMSESRYGQRIAHRALILSISIGLRSQTRLFERSMISFTELRSWRFVAPVFIGDTIRVRARVIERSETSEPDRGTIVETVEVVNQHGDVVQQGEMVALLKRRDAA